MGGPLGRKVRRVTRAPEPFPEPILVTRPVLPPLERLLPGLQDVWESQWLTNFGEQHVRLEERLCDFLGVRHLSLFNNGTIALLTACRVLELRGEVITTPFTFPATVHALRWCGVEPVFADVDPVTLTLDPGRVAEWVTSRTSGILAVHVYGTPCDVEGLGAVAAEHGLRVIYDAAHAFGVEMAGRGIASLGDISMFSFHATKIFQTAEGGALATADPDLKSRIDLLRNFGLRNEWQVVAPGLNGKLSELHALLGLQVLDLVHEEIETRRILLHRYRERLREIEGLEMVEDRRKETRSNHQYCVVRVDGARFGSTRDEVQHGLRRFNVFARRYFFPLCSDYPIYRDLPSANPVHLPHASRAAAEVLALPLYGAMSVETVDRICGMLAWLREESASRA